MLSSKMFLTCKDVVAETFFFFSEEETIFQKPSQKAFSGQFLYMMKMALPFGIQVSDGVDAFLSFSHHNDAFVKLSHLWGQ